MCGVAVPLQQLSINTAPILSPVVWAVPSSGTGGGGGAGGAVQRMGLLGAPCLEMHPKILSLAAAGSLLGLPLRLLQLQLFLLEGHLAVLQTH